MLTRLQIAQRIQANLSDLTGVFFDIPLINDTIQDAYDEVVVDTQCIENVFTGSFSPSTIYYDLYNGIIPDNNYFYRLSRIYHGDTNRWIRCVDARVLDKFRFDWETCGGTPWFAYIVNFQYLGLFPHYSHEPNTTFDILYKVGRDTLTDDNQVLQIPAQFIRIIECYGTADLLECYQEFVKAKTFWDEYYKLKQQLTNYLPSRSLPDKMWQLNDLDALHHTP